jgi:hypothetical protein
MLYDVCLFSDVSPTLRGFLSGLLFADEENEAQQSMGRLCFSRLVNFPRGRITLNILLRSR